MKLLRASAALLPAVFLLTALVFLVAHRPGDPALTSFPFPPSLSGATRPPGSPEIAFLARSAALFGVPYALWLALLALVSAAERGLLGKPPAPRASEFIRTFRAIYVALLVVASLAVALSSRRLSRRLGENGEPGALLVAVAPFVGGVAALLPAAAIALPVAFLRGQRSR